LSRTKVEKDLIEVSWVYKSFMFHGFILHHDLRKQSLPFLNSCYTCGVEPVVEEPCF
jgi:hypothetical protein